MKRVRTPQALCALLRVRTCPEVKIGRLYGKAQADRDHENLWHLVAAAPHDSLAFSLELAASRGFIARSGDRTPQPCIQVCARRFFVPLADWVRNRGCQVFETNVLLCRSHSSTLC